MNVNTYEIGILNVRIPFFVGDVTSSLSISVSLTMAVINHVNKWTLITQPNYEILQSDVSVNKSDFMNLLNTIEYLQSYQQTCQRAESVIAKFM